MTVYVPDADRAAMFATPRFVVKAGELVVEEGQLRRAPAGRRLHVRPGYDPAVERGLKTYFDRYATVSFENYPVGRAAGSSGLTMHIRGVAIEDTFAEAFGMRGARVIVTAKTPRWAREAATKLTGFATSVIACKIEAAIERELTPDETPDGRPGVSSLLFTMDSDSLGKRLTERIGQTVLTCPTASCFDGLPDAADRLPAGRALRTFGDRFQISKVVGGQRYWRVPVMEGECLLQESFGMQKKGVGGGNFLILAGHGRRRARGRRGRSRRDRRHARRDHAVSRRHRPQRQQGGRPRLQGDDRLDQRRLLPDAAAADGDRAARRRQLGARDRARRPRVRTAIAAAMRTGIEAACRPGVLAISAGNYGGKLGPHHFHLRQIMSEPGRGGPSAIRPVHE